MLNPSTPRPPQAEGLFATASDVRARFARPACATHPRGECAGLAACPSAGLSETVFSEHLARLDDAIAATNYTHRPTEAEALAALDAFDEATTTAAARAALPNYEEQRAALSDALFQASVNECPDCLDAFTCYRCPGCECDESPEPHDCPDACRCDVPAFAGCPDHGGDVDEPSDCDDCARSYGPGRPCRCEARS